jgi:hypothetical protein
MRVIKTVIGIALVLAACGGKQEATSPTSKPADKESDKGDGVLRGVTDGQLKIAHYATGDGTLGLVLDRSGPQAKVRIDGEKDIIELTMEEDRHGGERRGWLMKAPDGKNILYLTAHGGLSIYRGRDELRLNSDKAAEALGAPTIAGQYKRPQSEYDKQIEALAPHGLMKKSPQFHFEDSGNLAKVGEAIGAAPAESIYHVTAFGAQHAMWAPASRHIGDVIQGLGGEVGLGPSDNSWDKSKTGIAKFGGELVPMRFEYDSPNRLRMHRLKGFPAPIAANTPGILWAMDSSTVVFVTFDGGRYEIGIQNEGGPVIEPGAGAQSSWPQPLQHALVDVDTVRGLAKGKAVPEQVGKDIEAADDAWWACVNDQWKKAHGDIEKAQASQVSANDKWGKIGGIRKSAELAAPKACEAKKSALDAALAKFIESRNTERMAVLDKAKAKFK